MSSKKLNRTAPNADKATIRELGKIIAELESRITAAEAKAAQAPTIPAHMALVPIELLEKIAGDLGIAISTGTQLAAITSSAAATYQNDASLGHIGLTRFFNHHFGANVDSHHVARNALTLVSNAQFLAARIRAVIPARQATPTTDECACEARQAA